MIRLQLAFLCLLSVASTANAASAKRAISNEEEKFLNEEYTPPKEAPYAEESQMVDIKPQLNPEPEHKAYNLPNEPETKFEQTDLKKVTAKGEYIYKVKSTPQRWAAKLRVGPFAPPHLSNNINGTEITFQDVYGDTPDLMFLFDLEYQLFKSVGKLGLRVGSGFYTATGNGRFRVDPTKKAREVYTFYLAPNVVDAIYHLDYFGSQLLVPYVFGGGYYFTFVESRDDDAPLKYGGAAAANFGGGVALMLDGFDRQSVNQLDADYGVNHVYFIGEYEQIIGLNKTFDFTNELFTGGILIEF